VHKVTQVQLVRFYMCARANQWWRVILSQHCLLI